MTATGQPATVTDRGADPERVLGQLMLAFEGTRLSSDAEERLRRRPAAGVSLFRYANVESAAQVRELTQAMQSAARSRDPGAPPLLIAADVEHGQLRGLGRETAPFPGNLALGAAGDPELARRVGEATGMELRAVGVNVDYAPVCDLLTRPDNPALGMRAFGDRPGAVADLAAGFVRGLRSAGVAATAKHFPGLGDVAADPHHELPVAPHPRDRLMTTELVPFRAAIEAGVDLVMSAHLGVPGLTGDPAVPATLSRSVMHDLLRGELGFWGVSITDALDMGGLHEGGAAAEQVVAALRAGVDLLLCAPDDAARERYERALVAAARDGTLEATQLDAALGRVEAVRRWIDAHEDEVPPLDVVGSSAHLALAREAADRAVTLVRAERRGALLPSEGRVLAVLPEPQRLTPADTSHDEPPELAEALRSFLSDVEGIVTGPSPSAAEIRGVAERARAAEAVVVGTMGATDDPAQVELVRALLAAGRPVVTVALRTPFDLAAYPEADTHLCTYGFLRPHLDALAEVLTGRLAPSGRLPAAIPGLYPVGHRHEGAP